MKVVIAGAGIGGLTLAAALRARKVEVVVLERASSFASAGAGITVQPNAMVALRALGLDEPIAAAGARLREAAVLDPEGRPLMAPIDLEELGKELGAPTIALHRARLHDVLVAAVGANVVQTGKALVDYEERDGSVVMRTEDGKTVEGDVLVGADGLRSVVRTRLIGDGEPDYAGYTTWRGVTPSGSVEPPQRTSETWGRGERCGVVPIGHGEIYWFATANVPAGGSDDDVRGELRRRFGAWHEPIAAVLEGTPPDQILRTDASDRRPIRSWHRGRVVLLGDAAHPMTPNFGQGGCQAIEDAVVLADTLVSQPNLEAAFAEYESRRVARANEIVIGSRRFGGIAQWENPVACRLRTAILRATPKTATLRRMRQVLTFPG